MRDLLAEEALHCVHVGLGGVPVVMDDKSDAAQAYMDAVQRFLGEEIPHRFIEEQKKGLFGRLFGS